MQKFLPPRKLMIPLLTVDNQPDETEMTPASLLFAKPSSQLIRMIASRYDTINNLRTKRNASDEKVATFQAELKRTRHERSDERQYWNEKKEK